MAFPLIADLFPGGSLAPATSKSKFQDWLSATLLLLGDGASTKNARAALGVGAINFRNRLVNGGFGIDQANAGAAVSISTTTRTYGPDQWYAAGTAAAGVFTLTRQADAVRPGKFRLKVSVTTADASIAAGDRYYFGQAIEGNDVADWNLGTSIAEAVTVSFEIESEVTGTYGIRVTNAALNRSYVGTFAVSAANTRETKHVTLTLDNTGTWAIGTNVGMHVDICLAAGATYQTTAGAWAAGNFHTTSGQTNFMATIGNDMYFADMQIETGSIAARVVENVPYALELARCQRFYAKSYNQGVVPGAVSRLGELSFASTTTVLSAGTTNNFCVRFPAAMRTAPTVSLYDSINGGSAGNIAVGGVSSAASATASQLGECGFGAITNNSGGSWTATFSGNLHYVANARL
ncbi:MAG: hypothetical protein V4757_02175 [Pseudomonadota bacterium]